MAHSYNRSLIPVVDKRFQYKYTAIIVAIAAVVSAVLGYFLLNSYSEMNRIIDLALESPEISDKVSADQALRVFYISIVFFVFEVFAISVVGLLITHRLCGPVFIIRRQLMTLLEGKYPRAVAPSRRRVRLDLRGAHGGRRITQETRHGRSREAHKHDCRRAANWHGGTGRHTAPAPRR